MTRRPGLSVRLKLTLSYAGFVVVAGVVLLAAVAVFLLRYVPSSVPHLPTGFVPDRGALIEAFAPPAAAAMVFLIVLGLIGGWFLAGGMLAPLRRINHAAHLAASGTLSHRINLPGPRDELRDLADVFDTMLTRLQAHVAAQRRFAANASHELRTPLAISQTLLEVAAADPDPDVTALVERLRTVNTRAIELTEALLLLSRAERGAFARDSVDVSLVAEQACETLAPLAQRRGVSVEVTGAAVSVEASNALLTQLATNLVHNAIVHNLPEGGTVTVATGTRGGTAVLRVDNTGPVVSPQLVATLTEPFQRGGGRSTTGEVDVAGNGLGLAIAESIARAHHAKLSLRPGPGGGLIVEVVFAG